MTDMPTREPFASDGEDAASPRLLRLSDLRPELEAQAVADYHAYLNGFPRGPVTGIKPLDHELGGRSHPACTFSSVGRRSVRRLWLSRSRPSARHQRCT